MTTILRSRAGQVELRRRLAVARRGIEVLSRKQRLLRAELDALLPVAAGADADWRRAWSEATGWADRALRISHHRQLALVEAEVPRRASVQVAWIDVMNAWVPRDMQCDLPGTVRAAGLASSAASDRAIECLRIAVEAAAHHAALERATSSLGSELVRTARLVRLLERHRIPELERALTEVGAHLEEAEREDSVRLLRAREAPATGPREPSRSAASAAT